MSTPLVGALTDVVVNLTDEFRFFGKYAGAVVKQHADGTVDVRCDDSRVVVPSNLPIRYDSPGWSATVPVGTRCNVAFSDGDPRKPYACDFENGSITELAFDGGTKAVARVDDTVACGSIAIAGIASTIVFTYTPPTGAAQVVTVTLASSAGVTASVAGNTTLTLTGKITSGNTKLRA